VQTYTSEGLKTQVMAFYRLNMMGASITSVAVHDKGNVPGNGPLSQCSDQQLSNPLNRPFCRRRRQKPPTEACQVGRGHVDVALGRRKLDLVSMAAMVEQMPWPSLPWTPASAPRLLLPRLTVARPSGDHHHMSVCQAPPSPCAALEFSLLLLPSTTFASCFHYTLL
jgi:hypothetical protein